MHTITIFVESRYKVNRKKIKQAIEEVLLENGIQTPCEVSVAIVGDRKMKFLNETYRKKEGSTNVLSFVTAEGEQLPQSVPGMENKLGDIVISYPKVIMEAAEDEVLVDEKVDELVRHSMLHLLGLHHEE